MNDIIKNLAEMLNGLQYPKEPGDEILALAKENNCVIVFGSSDDLMEFRGSIYDEIGAWEGTTAYLNKDGLFDSDCECKYAQQAKEACKTIEAIWCEKDRDCSWSYKTEIPHIEFKVMEDDEIYCYGIVFSLDNLC